MRSLNVDLSCLISMSLRENYQFLDKKTRILPIMFFRLKGLKFLLILKMEGH